MNAPLFRPPVSTDADPTVAVIQCQQALLRGYAALDRRDLGTVAAGFAPNGAWELQGRTLMGRARIIAALSQAPADDAAIHVVQNIVVDVLDDDEATLEYLLLMLPPATDADRAPMPVDRPMAVARRVDRMARIAGRWLTRERTEQPLAGRAD